MNTLFTGNLGGGLSSSMGALPSLDAFNFQSLFASGDPKARISNIKKIGEGSSGTVYSGEDKKTKKDVYPYSFIFIFFIFILLFIFRWQ